VTARLNHTIVSARDHRRSAMFLSGILGLDPPFLLGPFAVVTVGDDLTLDFMETEGDITPQHYAFLVSETDFDEIFARIKARGLAYWADPLQKKGGRINSWDDGRGVYFEDPDGHLLEILTRPYGSAGTSAEHPHPLVAETLDGDDEAISQEAAVSEKARAKRGGQLAGAEKPESNSWRRRDP
jgi:catechol 2,3-dioxygenase-like lactoylglutathione lyase family enzyme